MLEAEAAPELDVTFTPEEQKLINAWKQRSQEADDLYDGWCAASEAELEEGGRTDERVVDFELRRGLLQFEGGFTEEAHETWSDVLAFVAKPSKKQNLINLVQAVIDSH